MPNKKIITISLDEKVLKSIEKRANKNMLSVQQQIEDIIRRSCVMSKTNSAPKEKLDDPLISIFSRRKHNLKKKK
ncbi:hypothetical protein HYW76_01730 [Candidatus Pacearchaeota archaeon]|nr:hypothetical protein [Candidatus Pacearchaeota archaeon]